MWAISATDAALLAPLPAIVQTSVVKDLLPADDSVPCSVSALVRTCVLQAVRLNLREVVWKISIS
jgi:hypothetical protein